jgi:hypothetical protein
MAKFRSPMMLYVVMLTLGLGACGPGDESGSEPHEHDHGDATVPHQEHTAPRDVATQPCDASNWLALNPDLRECRLASVNLDGTSMRRSNLSKADLTGASLVGADLFKAVLSYASLAGANVAGANFTSVDLTGANLTGANLEGTTLTNAVLTDALLDGARTDASTTCPNGTPGPCW